MTCNYVAAQITSTNMKRISRYVNPARNILKMSDFARAHNSLHVGVKEIMQVFTALPSVTHDLTSLSTDTFMYNVSA